MSLASPNCDAFLTGTTTSTRPPFRRANSATSSAPSSFKGSPFPSYIPVSNGPKPDFHDPNPLYSDAFENYPSNPFKANQSPPGTGSQRLSGRFGSSGSSVIWPS